MVRTREDARDSLDNIPVNCPPAGEILGLLSSDGGQADKNRLCILR